MTWARPVPFLLLSLALMPPAAAAEPPAKEQFGRKATPAPLAARAIGSYAKGCLAGGQAMAINGPGWQVMRLSRNRNWGHPTLIRYLERLAVEAREKDGWRGLLVGDIAQPRGGPMLTGHTSHQIGLDADIWLKPMPDHEMSTAERENVSAVSMIKDNFSIDPSVWTPAHVSLIKRAASYPEVERIFVHPAIKKALCEAAGDERRWLEKVRPWWGHHYHFHVRIACPKGGDGCAEQPDPPSGDGCGKPLEEWFALFRRPAPKDPKPAKPKPPLRMADLPADCRTVLEAGQMIAAPPLPEPVPALPAPVPAAAPVAASTAAAPPLPWHARPAVPLPTRKPR